MKLWIVSFLAGFLFAFGLAMSGMTQPSKIINFLDVTGQWDPSLMMVMVGAMGVYMVFYRISLKQKAPFFSSEFRLPTQKQIDKKLVMGSGIFGIGWGLSGFCPGPAITSLVTGSSEVLIFVGALALGIYLANFFESFLSKTTAANTPNTQHGK